MFGHMNSSQMIGMAPDHLSNPMSFYFYPTKQMNAGILLMNLQKMRGNKFSKMTSFVYETMNQYFVLNDQDVYNMIFAYMPQKLYSFPIKFNWQRDMCHMEKWDEVKIMLPMSVLHGTRGQFHSAGRFKSGQIKKTLAHGLTQWSRNIDMIRFSAATANTQLGPNVVFKSAFETFRDASLISILDGSQNMTLMFQDKLQTLGYGLKFSLDPCKNMVPYLLNAFMKASPFK